MVALLDDPPRLQHDDAVGVGDGREPMGDDQRAAPSPDAGEARLDRPLGPGVEGARRLVQHQDRRVLQDGARDPHPLLLAARQLQPALAHLGVVAMGQAEDEVVDRRRPGGLLHLRPRRPLPAIGDVVADGVVEQHRVLGNHADRRAQAALGDVAQILAVDQHRAAGRVVEAEQQPRQGRFARARGAHHRHRLARLHREAHPAQDLALGIVGEADVAELHPPLGRDEGPRPGPVGDLGRLLQQVEHGVHVDQRLADLAIDRAEEAERQGDLDHVGVDHDEVAHGQGARLHLPGRHGHHGDEARGDDQRLAGVQPGERHGGAGRRVRIARHGDVVARRLAFLGAEVLHRLVVQQAVDGLLVRLGVPVVHPLADAHPPFGHREGEPDIERDGDGGDRQIAPVEGRPEHDPDQDQLQRQGHDGEQQEAQQEVDALDPPLDHPAEAAGAPGQVIGERQVVDVAKGLERDLAQGRLADRGEDPVAQLGEGDPGEAQQAVGERGADRAHPQHPAGARRARGRGERVHPGAKEHRGDDGGDLGDDQRRHGEDHAQAGLPVVLRPEVGGDPADGPPAVLGGRGVWLRPGHVSRPTGAGPAAGPGRSGRGRRSRRDWRRR